MWGPGWRFGSICCALVEARPLCSGKVAGSVQSGCDTGFLGGAKTARVVGENFVLEIWKSRKQTQEQACARGE
jgi:hypothetical protein